MQGCGFGSAVFWIRIRGKAGSGSAIKSKFRSFKGSKWSRGEQWTLIMEASRLKNGALEGLETSGRTLASL
jgi:hypothetical protein